jgi:hypothetical protein
MSNENLQSLVEAIFTKCILRYGRDFTGRWEGLDLTDVKADWAHELEGVKPETVRHGLKNLPTLKDLTLERIGPDLLVTGYL